MPHPITTKQFRNIVHKVARHSGAKLYPDSWTDKPRNEDNVDLRYVTFCTSAANWLAPLVTAEMIERDFHGVNGTMAFATESEYGLCYIRCHCILG
jgi:hypothetical protein